MPDTTSPGEMEPLTVPKTKRARIGDTVRRAFSVRPADVRRVISRLSTTGPRGDDDAVSTTTAANRSMRPAATTIITAATATATIGSGRGRSVTAGTGEAIRRLNPFVRLGGGSRSGSGAGHRSVTRAPERMKICVIGDANAGKTAMIRYVQRVPYEI